MKTLFLGAVDFSAHALRSPICIGISGGCHDLTLACWVNYVSRD